MKLHKSIVAYLTLVIIAFVTLMFSRYISMGSFPFILLYIFKALWILTALWMAATTFRLLLSLAHNPKIVNNNDRINLAILLVLLSLQVYSLFFL